MQKLLHIGITVLFLLSPSWALAEYRAFRLKISGPERSFSTLSTLDPYQYADMHLAGQLDSVFIEKTWMCYGRTSGFLPICPSPDEGEVLPPPPPAVE